MLFFEDDTIQHAGHMYLDGDAGHAGTNEPRGSEGPDHAFMVEREIAGVTAACSMMPRKLFDEVGGFTQLLPVNFNDVDLSMKITSTGRRIYWTPYSELYHYESKTRVSQVHDWEFRLQAQRWGSRLHDSGLWPYVVPEEIRLQFK
jgi:GT2 family glycosyltransferase